MRTKEKPLYFMGIILAVFLLTALLVTGGCDLISKNAPLNSDSWADTGADGYGVIGGSADTVENVVSATSSAVVLISTKKSSTGRNDFFLNDPLLRQFFGESPLPNQEQDGLGSGFIISSDGYILTNEHVIDGADSITATIAGFDEPLEAKVVGADYNLDLALLKVNANTDLPFLKMGNSDQTRVGNWVIAIGNPYGLDHTVTVGVISAKGRPINVEDRQYENLLQTDASINPGNSGGPLINLQGEVIGINTAISAQAQGIGFAIPTSTVQRVLEDLKNGTTAATPWVGVEVRAMDRDAARFLGLESAEGALVIGVLNGSPAQRAGLKQWDVVTEFNGIKINNADELVAAIKATQVGQKVQVSVIRNRQIGTLEITIADKSAR